MCGIAGYLTDKRADWDGRAVLAAMIEAIRHRGPDDSGLAVMEDVGLGISRLSILDLVHGHQPMSSPDGRFTIVFNGEIYNHAELRDRFRAEGWVFTTSSDTEVLLAAWVALGAKCLPLLNGMFAFAVWDRRDQRLALARDRMGVKPLYWGRSGGRLLFASEIKALMASGVMERRLDRRGLWDYLTFRYVPGPGSIWQGISKLPPGHILTAGPRGDVMIERWWDIPYVAAPRRRSRETLRREFDALFTDAVRLRMQADVPVGILLSGGLDSSAVAAAAVESGHRRIAAFSVAFADAPDIDELPHARLVAAELGLDHHAVVIDDREFMDFLPDLVHFTDEPLADLASVPLYYVSRLARQSVKVVLSGEGADEILGGYDFDRVIGQWHHDASSCPWWRRLGGGPFPDLLDGRALPHLTNYLSSAAKVAWMKGEVDFPDSMDRVRDAFARCASADPLHRMLYSYCQDWLVEDLLMKADKMSMAASLELRTPFLDFRLVEWAAQAPREIKVDRAGDGWLTKAVLRGYAAARLPRAIVDRPKQGFPVPVYGWLSDRLRPWAHDLLANGGRLREWLNPAAIEEALRLGTATDAALMDRHRLWNLLVLELWSREWSPQC